MRQCMDRLEHILEFGGTKKEIVVLGISGAALVFSLFGLNPLPFDVAWIAIVLCGIPIILEAIIGMTTAFDIKADVLVSLALIASGLYWRSFRRRRGLPLLCSWGPCWRI